MTIIGVAGVSTPCLWWLMSGTQVQAVGKDNVPCLDESALLPTQGHSDTEYDLKSSLSREQVTKLISQDAYSILVKTVAGVNRYDGAQVASNSPCEDRYAHGKVSSPFMLGNYDDDGGGNQQWMAWAVFDGHSGWQTADLLQRQLLPFVRRRLEQAQLTSGVRSDGIIQETVKQGFADLDAFIFRTALDTARSSGIPLQEKVERLLPAYAGSCALLSLYDPVTRNLHVACTGDSRAVLAQQLPNGSWEATPLSIDQTGSNEDEAARICKEHPGEEGIVKNGRVLGMMVSRAFGDGQWKWPLEVQQEMKRRFYGPGPLPPKYDVRTPPYLTAEPVVTSTRIDPGKPSFLIMATDGLWDMLSSQQAVDLVGKWLISSRRESDHTYKQFDFGHFWNGVDWKFVEERATVQDDNAAVHLARNSLGGNHHELIAGRLSFTPPHSRRLRDDMTVQIVFFDGADPRKISS